MRRLGSVLTQEPPPSDTIVGGLVTFNGTGTVAILYSFNVSSITDNAVGDWTVNWIDAPSAAQYAISALGRYDTSTSAGAVSVKKASTPTTTAVIVQGTEGAGDAAVDLDRVCVTMYGHGRGGNQWPEDFRLVGAWVQFDITGAIQGTGYNVSSITDNGTGDWTVNYRAGFAGTDTYVVGGTCKQTSGPASVYLAIKKSVALTNIATNLVGGSSTGAAADPGMVYFMAWGQA